jgi:O-acetyl-ADP-ribose deacetylase (regulator of RNase III)
MLIERSADIFSVDTKAFVNPVNCVGVMGKGLARQFKLYYPDMYQDYLRACNDGSIAIGTCHVYFAKNAIIINAPTKKHWRNPSKLEYVNAALDDIVRIVGELCIPTVAIPRLGCGLGGLPWGVVRTHMVDKLENVDTLFYVCNQ